MRQHIEPLVDNIVVDTGCTDRSRRRSPVPHRSHE
jgi:hypothetical protein